MSRGRTGESNEVQALVVGSSGVLGSAITRRLCADFGGTQVLGTYFSNVGQMQVLERECECRCKYLDTRDEGAVEEIIALAQPRALALCTSASGSASGNALAVRMSASRWRSEVSEPLDSLLWMLRAALKYLPDGSRVVWLGSRVGEVGGLGQSAYATAKATGEEMVKAAAREGAGRGLAFNVVCPGFVLSPLTRELGEDRLRRERERDVGGALGSEQTCASLVAWLLSEDSRGISGQVLHADGRVT